MKTELKAKLIQQVLRNKKQNEGFTLIELLVVIIIIGILSAIALPSFLNQANKAKQSEAKTYIGSMNRGQQAYFLENDEFTDQVNDLGLGIALETALYKYKTVPKGTGVDAYALSYSERVESTAPLKNYIGKTYIDKVAASTKAGGTAKGGSDQYTTFAFMCETKNAAEPKEDDFKDGVLICPEDNYKTVGSKKKKA